MISVIIPLYNKAASVGRTLRAVLAQTYGDFEVVVVDDGSTDGGADVVRSVGDGRIHLVSQANAGVSAARNRGVREARGEFVAFLDADDEWQPDYLETQHRLTQRYPQCAVFATSYAIRPAGGEDAPAVLRRLPFAGEDGVFTNYFEVAACSHPPLWTSAVMVRRAAMDAVGGFPVGIRSGEDLLTWARLAVKYEVAYCRRPLAVFVNDAVLFNDDQKARMPERTDVVGRELAALLRAHPDVAGVRAYVALWHKMRARIFLDKGVHASALVESVRSLRFRWSARVVAFFVLALLPSRLSYWITHRLS